MCERPQGREDVAHEPVREQAVQQSIQGHHWGRLVSRLCAIHERA